VTGFPAAVEAIQSGDVAVLERLLDAEPALLRERLDDPDAPEYFRGARLLWYVADNPILIDTMPANVVDVARTLLARGAEREDLDATLDS